MQLFNKGFVGTCWWLSLMFLSSLSGLVRADTPPELSVHTNELYLQPNTCVSLHQGQTCFAELTISWHTTHTNNYCLYSSQQATPIQCWMDSKQGLITGQFSSTQTLHFYLKGDNSDTVVAESVLKVSWVYKKQQKSRLTWRLF